MSSAADEHRAIAGVFTDRVCGVYPGAWDNAAPCDGWVARDVVRHLVEWFPAFLKAGSGVDLPTGPLVDEDPVASWIIHCQGVKALLDDPATQAKVLSDPHLGDVPLDPAVECAQLLEEMLPMDEALRASGHFGPRVAVAETADVQTRLIAFIGRTP